MILRIHQVSQATSKNTRLGNDIIHEIGISMDSIHQAKNIFNVEKEQTRTISWICLKFTSTLPNILFFISIRKICSKLSTILFFRCQPQNFLKSVLAVLNHSLVLTILSVAQTEILSQMSGVNDTNILQCCLRQALLFAEG